MGMTTWFRSRHAAEGETAAAQDEAPAFVVDEEFLERQFGGRHEQYEPPRVVDSSDAPHGDNQHVTLSDALESHPRVVHHASDDPFERHAPAWLASMPAAPEPWAEVQEVWENCQNMLLEGRELAEFTQNPALSGLMRIPEQTLRATAVTIHMRTGGALPLDAWLEEARFLHTALGGGVEST